MFKTNSPGKFTKKEIISNETQNPAQSTTKDFITKIFHLEPTQPNKLPTQSRNPEKWRRVISPSVPFTSLQVSRTLHKSEKLPEQKTSTSTLS